MKLLIAGVMLATMPLQAQQPSASVPLVLDHVTVVDVEHGTLLPQQRIVIVGNRIQKVGLPRAVRIPSGARIIDAQDRYVIPGMWDMHVHPERNTSVFYPFFIANGITGIRDAWSVVPLDTLNMFRREILAGKRVGPPRQLLTGSALDDNKNAKSCVRKPHEGHICVADSADARHVVDSLKMEGADMLKMYSLSQNMYFVIAAEARRIGIPFGGHIGGHLGQRKIPITAMQASDSGVRILDHVNSAGGLDSTCFGRLASIERCQPIANQFLRNDTWWVPTLTYRYVAGNNGPGEKSTAAQQVLNQAGVWAKSVLADASALPARQDSSAHNSAVRDSGVRDSTVRNSGVRDSAVHDSTMKNVTPQRTVTDSRQSAPEDSVGFLHIAHEAGLPILAGTDVASVKYYSELPGFTLHTELAIYVSAGLTPLEALQTATLNPAKMLHATDSLGTVESGKLADLVLLDANPLIDITNTRTIRAVIANGRFFDRTELNQLLQDASKVRIAN